MALCFLFEFDFLSGVDRLHLCTADAVRRNSVTCRAVDADVVQTIKDWLRFAKDREGGRQRRAAKART